jgi:hypothetical protein
MGKKSRGQSQIQQRTDPAGAEQTAKFHVSPSGRSSSPAATGREVMDRKLDQPVATCRLPHAVIVRAPGLLPMLYAPSELAEELRISIHTIREWFKHGLPRQRDARGHNWIDGRRFANWVAELNHARSARSIGQAEAYCVRCRKPVRLIDPVRSCQGKKVLLRGVCPGCGGSIFRGARRGQSD